jgi:CRP-like cAMP-binding protein
MGVITGQPRTANVIADGQVSVFEISKIKFEVLIKKYPDIGFSIYRNVIHTLSGRLDTTNKQLVTSQHELEQVRSGADPALEASANLDS